MKISELYKLNNLNEKCEWMCNHHAYNGEYDYYMLNGLNWLLENADKINDDFKKDFERRKDTYLFNILVNSNLDDYKMKCIDYIKSMDENKAKPILKNMINGNYYGKLDEIYNNIISKNTIAALNYFESVKRR